MMRVGSDQAVEPMAECVKPVSKASEESLTPVFASAYNSRSYTAAKWG